MTLHSLKTRPTARALKCAVVGKNRNIIDILLHTGADARDDVYCDESPLEVAARTGITDVVAKFLHCGKYAENHGKH